MKIKSILENKSGVAFEFFPPKTDKGEKNLFKHLTQLEKINPGYVSITYGAGGTSSDNTHNIVIKIAKFKKNTVMAHLTCIGHSREEIHKMLADYKTNGVENIMALRGDPPQDSDIKIGDGDFPNAIDLVRFIREEFGDHFSIGGAAFPELHPESPDMASEMKYFKQKSDAGMDFAVSQMFFDNRFFYNLIDNIQKNGIDIPILPGIMPITNYTQIKKFADLSNAKMPTDLIAELEKHQDDTEAVYKIGVEHSQKQCERLIKQGFEFLHFFTLNKSNATLEIYNSLQGGRNADKKCESLRFCKQDRW